MKTTKRIVSAVLCVLMIGSIFPLASFAAYENTHVNTGNQIEDLVAVATTQIGYTEGNSISQQGGTSGGSKNYTKYGAWYGLNPDPWCAMFVSWCANKAGIPTTVIPKHASCDIGMQWFQGKGLWKWSKSCGGSYTPKRGDIIYFRTNTAITYDSTHVGIVYNCDGSTVYTIEGNASNKCQTKSYALSDAYILGYGTPAYTDNSGGGSTSTGASGLGTYRLSGDLNMRTGAGTSYSVVTTVKSGAEINITQISSNNWGYCTYNGYSGWVSLNTTYTTLISTYYYMTFDPNGGVMTSDETVYAITIGTTYTAALKGTLPTAKRSGYDFDGWYCEKYNFTLDSNNMGNSYSEAENVTFKAEWIEKPGQYNVTASHLNFRDGASSAGTTVLAIIEGGTKLNITIIQGDWGYTTYGGKNGWVSLAYCEYVGPVQEETEPDDDDDNTTTYTLTFNVNGGTMPAGYSTTYELKHNQELREVIPGFPIPTHSDPDIDFAGWYWIEAGPDSRDYLFNGGWGTQQYIFWNPNNPSEIIDAVFLAKWVSHSCTYESSVTKAATCIADGITTYTCTGCGDSYTETTEKLGHSYTSAVTKAPSCTETGVVTYTCTRCGNDYVEDIAITSHTYTLVGNEVKCTCGQLSPTGWYGEKYCLNGQIVAGLFNVDGDYYFASLTTWNIVKNQTVYVTTTTTPPTNNGFLAANGDSYYMFDSEGKMIQTGFVTGGGKTYYYEDAVKVTGLKPVDSDYYYFNDDGTMVKNQYVAIDGGYGLEAGNYYFRADGKMLAKDDGSTREVKYESDGKCRLYINGVVQTNGLFYVNGDYYYALNDGTLATNRTLYTYYSNELFTPGYYKFGSDKVTNTIDDAKMEKGTWYFHFDGVKNRIYATKSDGTREEGVVLNLVDNNYYFFHKNSGELVTNETIFISADNDNGYGVKPGAYKCDANGMIENIIFTTSATALATADGAETGTAAFSAQAEVNTVVSADTAATVIIATLPVASDDEDE
ncbi:MAG: CHAP domain-containing protein [Clostridia bacterium]|nr:CHAP domain-containing protein [Clostridia bacterium]